MPCFNVLGARAATFTCNTGAPAQAPAWRQPARLSRADGRGHCRHCLAARHRVRYAFPPWSPSKSLQPSGAPATAVHGYSRRRCWLLPCLSRGACHHNARRTLHATRRQKVPCPHPHQQHNTKLLQSGQLAPVYAQQTRMQPPSVPPIATPRQKEGRCPVCARGGGAGRGGRGAGGRRGPGAMACDPPPHMHRVCLCSGRGWGVRGECDPPPTQGH